jgi:uncharacterized protein with beta-barrel porin domain
MSFKVRLLLGAAAPLVFVLPAAAQTTINTATTAPVTTSTLNSGAPADLIIDSAGSITPTAGTANVTAVTVNSNNTVTNKGSIALNNSDNSTGILFQPNLTTGYVGTGSITVLEDYTRSDTNSDGVLDGALATGTGRYGIKVNPGGTFLGDLLNSGGVTVEGNNSAGISVQSAIQGNLTSAGAISVTGNNGFGLDLQKNVSGNVRLTGGVSVQGQASQAVRVLGDIGGEFMNSGSITATGYSSSSVTNINTSTSVTTVTPPALTADELLISGSAMQISGNLAFGFLNNGAATGTVVDTTTDVKDVIQNFNVNRGTGSIGSFGSAPALDIAPLSGAAGRNITFAKVRESVPDTLDDDADGNTTEIIGVFNYDYGLINRGSILGSGLNTGVDATAVRIAGSADGAYTTTIAGGIFNSGSISTTAHEANAIGLDIGRGATTPQLVNTGQISAADYSPGGHTGTAVLIRQGASLGSVTNSGLISSTSVGFNGDAVAFRDLSGTVTSVTNTSRIVAGHSDNDTTDAITSGTGRSIALDFAANVTGVTLTQTEAIDNARIFGDVLFGSGADRFDLLSGQAIGNVDFGAGGADTLNINSALLSGNAVFHGPTASVTLANGALMAGALNFGTAAATINFSGSSNYDGAITNTGAGRVGITLNKASLTQRASTALAVSSFSATNGSQLNIDVSDARIAGAAPVFVVAGSASLSADTKIAPVFSQVQLTPFTVRVIQANTLTLGGPIANMLDAATTPFLYQLGLAQTGNNIDLSLRVKTIDELGLGNFQRNSYDAVLNLLRKEDTLGAALTQITDAATFDRAYNDLLPPNDTSIMKVLATNASAAMGATGRRLDLVSDKPNAPGGAWLEEFGLFHNADATKDSLKTSGGGFGVAGGFDLISYRDKVLGAYFSLDSAKLEEDGRTSAPLTASQTVIGGYGGWKSGALSVNGSAGYGFVTFDDKRDISVSTLTDKVVAKWKGNTIQAAGRASYEIPIGFLRFKPYVAADYLGLNQDGYTETATTLSSLALVTDSASSHLATASAGVMLAAHFDSGSTFRIDPEITLGYKSVLSFDSSPATAHFLNQTSSFKLGRGTEPENALLAGFGINVSSQYLNLKLGYDAEISDTSITHYGSITLRLAFW